MRIAVLQTSNVGFFPRYYQDLRSSAKKSGDIIRLFSCNSGQNRRRDLPDRVLWGHRANWFVHFNLYRLTGLQDIFSVFSTLDLIHKLKKYGPEVIHFNIINEWAICYPLLVRYLNRHHIPVVWTFHDPRLLSGSCLLLNDQRCDKWKTGCGNCSKETRYQNALIDATSLQWKIRRKFTLAIEVLHIVTPSRWMASIVGDSFLKSRPIHVINNGIDTDFFSSPSSSMDDYFKKYPGKKVLAVANVWLLRKGLDSLVWLSQHLPQGYNVFAVGHVEEDMKASLPSSLHLIPRTSSKEELSSIYQNSDVLVNPTLVDNFPTVNIEALASGLPIATFNTGGSPEIIDHTCGISVPKGDNEALLDAVLTICQNPGRFSRENCKQRSRQFSLSQFDKYIELFHSVV